MKNPTTVTDSNTGTSWCPIDQRSPYKYLNIRSQSLFMTCRSAIFWQPRFIQLTSLRRTTGVQIIGQKIDWGDTRSSASIDIVFSTKRRKNVFFIWNVCNAGVGKYVRLRLLVVQVLWCWHGTLNVCVAPHSSPSSRTKPRPPSSTPRRPSKR